MAKRKRAEKLEKTNSKQKVIDSKPVHRVDFETTCKQDHLRFF